jgi:hypothetical protein
VGSWPQSSSPSSPASAPPSRSGTSGRPTLSGDAKLISRFPGDGPLYPDATLGQDVAFVAMMLQDHKDKLAAARAALEECAGALEPFASICVPGETWVGTDPATLLLITKRDLERAAAAARKAREVGGGR